LIYNNSKIVIYVIALFFANGIFIYLSQKSGDFVAVFPRSDPAAIVVAVQRFGSVYSLIAARRYSPHIIFVIPLS